MKKNILSAILLVLVVVNSIFLFINIHKYDYAKENTVTINATEDIAMPDLLQAQNRV